MSTDADVFVAVDQMRQASARVAELVGQMSAKQVEMNALQATFGTLKASLATAQQAYKDARAAVKIAVKDLAP